ncbi:MAG: ATP-binding protein [Isosphaeraceae bacterium]
MNRFSIRLRLTAWYAVLMAPTIAGLGLVAWLLMARSLRDRIDSNLDFEFHEAAERLASGLPASDPAEAPSAFHEVYHLLILDSEGRVVSRSPALEGIKPIDPGLSPGHDTEGRLSHQTAMLGPLGECRIVSGVAERRVVQIITSLASYRRGLAELGGILWTILPAGMAAATVGGYWLTGRALAPVGRMTEAARRISAANLAGRISTTGRPDELGLLAGTLNEMLDRIDLGFRAVRRFTADAAHELKTPLATIRTEVEVALAGPRSPASDAETFKSVVEEADRLARLVDRLLILSKEDAGTAIRSDPIRLDSILRESASGRPRGPSVGGLEALPPIGVEGDPVLLRLAFDNLLDNAEKATAVGGSIALKARIERGAAVVEVVDTGIGIPPAELPRIFDRFYRVDPSRSRRTGGTGLGLSIVKSVVERHGGSVGASSVEGSGSTFRVELPIRVAPGRAQASRKGRD